MSVQPWWPERPNLNELAKANLLFVKDIGNDVFCFSGRPEINRYVGVYLSRDEVLKLADELRDMATLKEAK